MTSGKVKNKKREQSFVLMRNVDKKGKSKKDPQTHNSLTLGSKSSSYVFFFFWWVRFNLVLIVVTNNEHAFAFTGVYKSGAEVEFPRGILRQGNALWSQEPPKKHPLLYF